MILYIYTYTHCERIPLHLVRYYIYHITYYFILMRTFSSTILVNFSYKIECYQLQSPYFTFDPQILFISQLEVCTLSPTSPYFLQTSALGSHFSTLCFYEVDLFTFHTEVITTHYLSLPDLFHSTQCPRVSSTLLQVAEFSSSSWLNNITYISGYIPRLLNHMVVAFLIF